MAKDTLDFIVVIKDARGQRRGSLAADDFRAAMSCPKTAFLADCIARWNDRQEREGAEDRAELEIVATRKNIRGKTIKRTVL